MKQDNIDIEKLLNKYFEGLTSLQEEESLRKYFQGDEIPDEFQLYQPMFQYFTSCQETMTTANQGIAGQARNDRKMARNDRRGYRRIYWWISIAAAACFILFFGLKFTFNSSTDLLASSLMYIDGKKYTDIERIQLEAIKALDNFSEDNDDAYSSQVEALDLFFNNN
ncbi:hypothetical protein FACS189440_09050 [Bacteroidia bacterium]|nr:hypothetical protein FACS189440_09050 [Bacteroidia bacterium]